MRTPTVVDTMWLVLAAAGAGLQVAGLWPGTAMATIGVVLKRVTAGRVGRVTFLLGWAWLGWHLFAR